MTALWNGAGHYILPCGFFFYLLFSLPIPSRLAWCGLSANLGCRSRTCCTRLVENTGRKKSPKIRNLRTVAQLCRAISLQLRHMSTIGKKLAKQQYLHHVFSQCVNFDPLAAEIGSLVWGTPANFNGIASLLRYCSDVARRKPTKLHDVWPSPTLIH